MHLTYLPFFLTLVVLWANAAPDNSIVPSQIKTKEVKTESTKGPIEQEAVQVTTLPEVPLKPRRSLAYSDAANSFGVGHLSGPMEKEKESNSISTFHAQRTQYNLDESAQEFGLQLTSNGFFGIDWGFKKFCCFASFASAFQPFYKIGAAGIFEPKDQLGNLIDYRRYFLQVSAGSENLFFFRRSLRFETGFRYGYPGFHLYAQLLYAFPD